MTFWNTYAPSLSSKHTSPSENFAVSRGINPCRCQPLFFVCACVGYLHKSRFNLHCFPTLHVLWTMANWSRGGYQTVFSRASCINVGYQNETASLDARKEW